MSPATTPSMSAPSAAPTPLVAAEAVDWSDRSMWAVAEPRVQHAPAPSSKANAHVRRSPRELTRLVATAQSVLMMVLLVIAPAITLLVNKHSGLAFAAHGIGAVAVAGLATMAMHKAYPLLRGGTRTWQSFRQLLRQDAPASLVQGASSLWILHYYLAGPHQILASVAAPIDGLVLQFKIAAGMLSLGCFVVAWWSARHATDEREDASRMASVFAVIVGWMLMVCALVLGTAISWVMPV